MATRYQLGKQELKILNQDLTDCELIKQDLDRAEMAGVPNIEHLREAVAKCEERINNLLAHYNPRGKK